jgi:hypothetical protein
LLIKAEENRVNKGISKSGWGSASLVRKEWSFFGLSFGTFLLLIFFNIGKPATLTSEHHFATELGK